MRIGIASPITIPALAPYLFADSLERASQIAGMSAPSVDALVGGLLARGHDIVVFTLDVTIREPLCLYGPHLKVCIGKYTKNGHLRALTFFLREIMQLRKFILSEKPDVLHAHWSYEFAIASFSSNIPTCVTFRDYAPVIFKFMPNFYRFMRLLMNWYVVRHSEKYHAIANSQYMSELLLRHWHIQSDIIPNPISRDFIRPANELPLYSARNKRIVSICHGWSKRKNINALLSAFSIVKKQVPEAELVLIGEAFEEESDSVKQFCRLNPEQVRDVTWKGHVPHNQLACEIGKSALLVHPSLEESFGNTLLEGMAQGIPVIGGIESGAVPYVLNNGEAGCLCDVTNPNRIAEAIVNILNDGELWLKYSRAGYHHVVETFDLIKIISSTEQVYSNAIRDCIQSKKAP